MYQETQFENHLSRKRAVYLSASLKSTAVCFLNVICNIAIHWRTLCDSMTVLFGVKKSRRWRSYKCRVWFPDQCELHVWFIKIPSLCFSGRALVRMRSNDHVIQLHSPVWYPELQPTTPRLKGKDAGGTLTEGQRSLADTSDPQSTFGEWSSAGRAAG